MLRKDKEQIVRRRIAAWYRKHRRELQWRFTTDPYEILVSEIMLQQTQVSRVIGKLPTFLATFPNFGRLASARRSDVLRAWKGMGYNNRAVRLHEMAQTVAEQFNGTLPDTVDALLALPGIGKYTAHAVLCFAYRKRVPVVDVNIIRVYSRVFHRMKSPGEYRSIDAMWETAHRMLPRNAYDWNQALMDLGATICTARAPQCGRCPLADLCASRSALAKVGSAKTSGSSAVRKPEPSYAGVPRRIWRGRIVDALRHADASRGLPLATLGRKTKMDFSANDIPWLKTMTGLLAADGVVRIEQRRSTSYVSLVD